MNPVQFADHVGSEILLLIPRVHAEKYQSVKLVGVEPGGLWIESQEVTNAVLQIVGVVAASKTPVIFWPYHEIAFAIVRIDSLSLDERAFGL